MRSNSVYEHIDWKGFSEEEKKKWLLDYERIHEASNYLLMANGTGNLLDILKYCMEGLAILPENPALHDLRKRTEKDIYNFCSELLLSGRKEAALLHAGSVLEIHTKSAVPWMIKSRYMQAKGEIQKGLEAAEMAVNLAPDNADTHFLLGSIMLSAEQFKGAISEYRQALKLSEKRHKYAIYSRVSMLDALAQVNVATGMPEMIEASSGERFGSMLPDRWKETTEGISRSNVSSEAAGSLVE